MTESEAKLVGRVAVLLCLFILRIIVSVQLGKQFGVWTGLAIFTALNSLSSIDINLYEINERSKR